MLNSFRFINGNHSYVLKHCYHEAASGALHDYEAVPARLGMAVLRHCVRSPMQWDALKTFLVSRCRTTRSALLAVTGDQLVAMFGQRGELHLGPGSGARYVLYRRRIRRAAVFAPAVVANLAPASAAASETAWVEICLVTADNRPKQGVRGTLEDSAGTVHPMVFDSAGLFRLQHPDVRDGCILTLDLDADLWRTPLGCSEEIQPGPERPQHTVRRNDCAYSIAALHGIAPTALWQADPNADLRACRLHPSTLAVGDSVHVPPMKIRRVRVAAGKRHLFEVVEPTVQVRLQVGGAWLAGCSYELSAGEQQCSGKLDADGACKAEVPAGATRGRLVISTATGPISLQLNLAGLDPHDSLVGAQQRLSNLGLYAHAIDGVAGPHTDSALRRMQNANELATTGQIDPATLSALQSL